MLKQNQFFLSLDDNGRSSSHCMCFNAQGKLEVSKINLYKISVSMLTFYSVFTTNKTKSCLENYITS